MLQDQGLIKLKDGAGLTATKKDIVENKKDLAIKEIEAAQIPRSLKDVDIAVVNGNYALEAGLKVNKDALATEDADSIGAKTYGNVVAVKKGNEKTDATKSTDQSSKEWYSEKIYQWQIWWSCCTSVLRAEDCYKHK